MTCPRSTRTSSTPDVTPFGPATAEANHPPAQADVCPGRATALVSAAMGYARSVNPSLAELTEHWLSDVGPPLVPTGLGHNAAGSAYLNRPGFPGDPIS